MPAHHRPASASLRPARPAKASTGSSWDKPAWTEEEDEIEAEAAAREAETPLRRLGEVEDIAGAAVYLASRAGAWTTGQTLVVDGGLIAATH